ncbi:MAG: ROK family protein, partial [Parasporobacterium sp.]|nr:ROK family protein [Parasporobacterium sp.]
DAAGRALANASAVADPDIFVIGGGVSKAGQFLLDRVQAAFKRHAYPAAVDTAFALSSLGNDAGMYGAASVIADIL